ncbi:hypothetical protein RKD37_002635 [Streptomyces ambofaciens]
MAGPVTELRQRQRRRSCSDAARRPRFSTGCLRRARGGSGGALVVWGEPGIGKSALLRHVYGQAADFVRLSHSATRPESDLAFAGLHGLLRPSSCTIHSHDHP